MSLNIKKEQKRIIGEPKPPTPKMEESIPLKLQNINNDKTINGHTQKSDLDTTCLVKTNL